jgi:hypothetical protein
LSTSATKREHLDFFQQMMHGTCRIPKQAMVSFVAHNPNAGKSNELKKTPAYS